MKSDPSTTLRRAVHAGENIFLTGMAGTGKSTLLRGLIEELGDGLTVTASTGIAALNIGGMTVHRWSGMMLGPKRGEDHHRYLRNLLSDQRFSVRAGFNRVRDCERLVIDEVSMLSGDTLRFLDLLCRTVRRDERPFGGIQVIATGDFLQLPPVRIFPNDPHDWPFQTDAWLEARFLPIHLTKVHRQDEPEFLRALSGFRMGELRADSADVLRSRISHFPNGDLTRLFTHNAQVDRWNAYRLACNEQPERAYQAELRGPDTQVAYLIKNLLTPQTLVLKPGARVMFTVNRPDEGFVNGQAGIVTHCGSREVTVETHGSKISVEPFTWLFDHRDKHSASFTQFPLRLAYALTIHKAQGATLDAAYIDVRAAREPGQAYVALSRVRTLAGLHLKDWFSGFFVSRAALEFYEGMTPSQNANHTNK